MGSGAQAGRSFDYRRLLLLLLLLLQILLLLLLLLLLRGRRLPSADWLLLQLIFQTRLVERVLLVLVEAIAALEVAQLIDVRGVEESEGSQFSSFADTREAAPTARGGRGWMCVEADTAHCKDFKKSQGYRCTGTCCPTQLVRRSNFRLPVS